MENDDDETKAIIAVGEMMELVFLLLRFLTVLLCMFSFLVFLGLLLCVGHAVYCLVLNQ